MAARGALADAGLHARQVDGLFMANLPGLVPAFTLAEHLGIEPRWSDTTRIGGTAFLAHVHHAVRAIEAGACSVALVVYGSLSRSGQVGIGTGGVMNEIADERETLHGATIAARYAMFASRHMHEFGTTLEQLAAPAVSASQWGTLNPHAARQGTTTIEEVLASPPVADPLTTGMCCVITDGGGAIVVARNDIARDCRAGAVRILGSGEYLGHRDTGSALRFTESGSRISGAAAFRQSGLAPRDIDFCMLYDSFTITILTALEDLGFCAKGEGGAFVEHNRLGPGGALPTNMDGGGLRNNHPGMRGIFLIIEAVRQLRGEAGVRQVKDAEIGIVNGIGGTLDARHGAATLILGAPQ
ncbi:MAG: thiolase [Burkholderiaceae bacterium]|nr:thiolase [Burkholderiaceae bacterium]